MSQAVLFDLEHHRKRLDYYLQLKAQVDHQLALNTAPVEAAKKKAAPAMGPTSVDKWIEIYAERVKKLENQVVRLGLLSREQLKAEKERSSQKPPQGSYVH